VSKYQRYFSNGTQLKVHLSSFLPQMESKESSTTD